MHTPRTILSALLLIFFTAGCLPASDSITEDELQTVSPTAMMEAQTLSDEVTSTPLPTPTLAHTAVEMSPTPTATPTVRVTAINGNLYIRRGPGTAYNRIGLLSKDTGATVIGRDMLSNWVQVNIPDAEYTGWVSLLTPYSKVDGDLSQVPAFTFKEWPEPAFIKNCTEHNLLVTPNELFLYSLWTNSSYLNEVQVDPGVYEIHDLFVPGEPMIEQVDVQEGETVYITVNGLGVKHNCP